MRSQKQEPRRRGDSFSTYLRMAQQQVPPAASGVVRGAEPALDAPKFFLKDAAQRILAVLQEHAPLPVPELMRRSELDLITFTAGLEQLQAKGKVALCWDADAKTDVAALVSEEKETA